jgi:hypothetical protein
MRDGVSEVIHSKLRGVINGRERLVFVGDHLLFGFVLNEMRERPRG